MFLPNSGILAAGANIERTYTEYVAHITSIATNGAVSWTSELLYSGTTLRKFRATASTFSGQLYGSPAAARFGTSSVGGSSYNSVARIIQHSLPDGDVTGATPGQVVYFEVQGLTTYPALVGKTVNGYTSLSIAANFTESSSVPRIIWWSDGRAWWRNPFNNTAPEPYDW